MKQKNVAESQRNPFVETGVCSPKGYSLDSCMPQKAFTNTGLFRRAL